ncbi:flavanone 3-dioxygenase 3-like [Malus domestica]|uniref:flavanone 3-dioxygenase 3-like n=1 Tax=Malus domestica TaxID=3750 RepID=UPI00397687BB
MDGKSLSSFSMGKSAQEKGLPYVPECYVIPTSQRASLTPDVVTVPTIDFGRLKKGPDERALVIGDVRTACRQLGFFQIENHGIRQTVLDEALSSATEFFKLPVSEKAKFMSNDVHGPVRLDQVLA